MLRTSSSLSCRKSSYAPPTAMNGSGVERHTTRSAIDRSTWTAWRAPTGTATTTAAGAWVRTAATAASIVEPVARPSSTRRTVASAIPRSAEGKILARFSYKYQGLDQRLTGVEEHSRRGLEGLAADAQSVDDLLVAEFSDLPTNHGQRSHGELAACWHADLAYQDHSELGVQPGSHLGGNWYAAAWKCQYDWFLKCRIDQLISEYPAGNSAIGVAGRCPAPPYHRFA